METGDARDEKKADGQEMQEDTLGPQGIGSFSRIKHPDEIGDDWHPCRDFIDPLADELKEWLRDSEARGLDYSEPTTLDRLMCILVGIVVDGPGSAPDVAAWPRARAWFEVQGPAGFGDRFAARVQGVWEEMESLERRLDDLEPDENLDIRAGWEFEGFLVTVIEPFIADLRNWSRELKRRFPPKVPPVHAPDTAGCGTVVSAGSPDSSQVAAREDHPQAGTAAELKPAQPVVSVEKWSDLGIGIDANGCYLACVPCPDTGAVFPREKAVKLDLPGKQWKALFDLLSHSENGNSAKKKDVMADFGYMEVRDIEEANISELAEAGYLTTTLKSARNTLTRAMADLGRKLRRQVKGPTGKGVPVVLSVSDDKNVEAAFVVRHLVRGYDGKLRFGT
jgi:hypothetical protein